MQTSGEAKGKGSTVSARALLPSNASKASGGPDAHALAEKLKLTLSYHLYKVEKGWAENTLSEVEALFEKDQATRSDHFVLVPAPLPSVSPNPQSKSKTTVRPAKKIKLLIQAAPSPSPSFEEGSSPPRPGSAVAAVPPPPLVPSVPPSPRSSLPLLPRLSPSFTLMLPPKDRVSRPSSPKPSSIADLPPEGLVDVPLPSAASFLFSAAKLQNAQGPLGTRRRSEPIPLIEGASSSLSSFVASFQGPHQEPQRQHASYPSHRKPSRSPSMLHPSQGSSSFKVPAHRPASSHASSSSHVLSGSRRVASNSPLLPPHAPRLSHTASIALSCNPSTPPRHHHRQHSLPNQQSSSSSSSSLHFAQPQPQPQPHLPSPIYHTFGNPQPSYPPPPPPHLHNAIPQPSRKRSRSHNDDLDPFDQCPQPFFLQPSFQSHAYGSGDAEGLIDGGGWVRKMIDEEGGGGDDDDDGSRVDFASVLGQLEDDLERAAAGREERQLGVGVQNGWAVLEGGADGGFDGML